MRFSKPTPNKEEDFELQTFPEYEPQEHPDFEPQQHPED